MATSTKGLVEGMIYEVAIKKSDEDPEKMSIVYEILRNDKKWPNSWRVVSNITDIVLSDGSKIDYVDKMVTAFSHSCREYLYTQVADLSSKHKRFIDVGTGRLQSKSAMLKAFGDNLNSLSATFIDPALDMRVISRAFQSTIDITNMDNSALEKTIVSKPHEMPRIRMCKRPMEATLTDAVVNHARANTIPICYAFSLNHVFPSFMTLAHSGVTQAAISYIFPDRSVKVLFEHDDVYMKIADDGSGLCRCKFGSGEEYLERPVYLDQIATIRRKRVMRMVDYIDSSSFSPSVMDVIQHIYIIVTLSA
jgi:hypothetical protein